MDHSIKKILETEFSELSRRDFLKGSALLSASGLLSSANAQSVPASGVKSKAKILIVGGGDAGITISARLMRGLNNPDITVVDPSATHFYQPGQTLVGSGVWDLDDISYQLTDVLHRDVKLIPKKAQRLDPDHNQVHIEDGTVIDYDYLVLCTGLELHYEHIDGLSREKLGKDGVNSIYAPEAASKTFEAIKNLAELAKHKKVKALFTHPSTPIKCGGAPKKITYLTEHYLREKGVRDNVEISFLPNGGKYFPIPEYDAAIKKQFESRNINAIFKHNLQSIDTANKSATFLHSYDVKGAYDKDLEVYDTITKTETVTKEYDMIHVVPPMKAHDFVKNSPLAWQKGTNGVYGFIEVDPYTLQHRRYKNVFGAGDVIGTKYGKTGGSVRKQAPVVAQNLIAVMQGKEPTATYSGYTVCPLITGYGTVMLAEFDYNGLAPSFPLDPTQERWIWWLLKVYGLKPMYFYGMLKGRM